jgi:hypothetical protein
LYCTSPGAQQAVPWHCESGAQQSRVLPHPSECPHPTPPKSAHVFGVHGAHTLFWHESPGPHCTHERRTPQPRSTGLQPVTAPASSRSAQALGVQQPPSAHVWLVSQVPQLTPGPHPLLAVPHFAAPQVGGVQAVHVPATHLVAPLAPVQSPQITLPLPHALGTVPHLAPASVEHSGGVWPQVPPMHASPGGHEHCWVCPHPSVTVPQRCVLGSGVHVTCAQPPASCGDGGTHWLPTQSWPAGQPPHPTATPHESTPTTPHLPVHAFG